MKGKIFSPLMLGLLMAAIVPTSHAQAPLTAAQIKEKYQSCQDGYYSGPRQGKTHYTKDEYLWVVSEDFAKRYCMPPEFMDKNLKGAEAVAFRLLQEGAEQCGYGGNKENCSRRTTLGFEIYYKKTLKMPEISSTKYSAPALYMYPLSKHLLSSNLPYHVTRKDQGSSWKNERPGAQPKFKVSSLSLVGVKDNRAVWPITSFGEVMYIEELLPGFNFLALQGSTGHFANARMEKLGVKKFSIVFSRPEERRDHADRSYPADYAHVIELPEWFTEKVRAADKTGAAGWQQLIQRSLPLKK